VSDERFQHLEFEDKPQSAPAPAVNSKDQNYFLAEARKAFLEGDYEPALRSFSESLKHEKALHEGWAGQVRCLVYLGELHESRTWSEKACNLFPEVPLLESARARALAACGFLGEALAASDKALEQAEKTGLADPHLWLERGACLLANRQLKTAEHCFSKALELRPNDPDWIQRVAVEWLEGAQPSRALELARNLVEQRPKRAYAWLLQARAQRRLGQTKAALESVERAEELRPNWEAAGEERRLLRRGCWIATLVFGHERHPHVVALRRWREIRWLTHPLGRWLAAVYDFTAPRLCGWLARCPAALIGLRWGLSSLAQSLNQREESIRGKKTRTGNQHSP